MSATYKKFDPAMYDQSVMTELSEKQRQDLAKEVYSTIATGINPPGYNVPFGDGLHQFEPSKKRLCVH